MVRGMSERSVEKTDEEWRGVLTPEQMITLSEMSDIVDPPKEEK